MGPNSWDRKDEMRSWNEKPSLVNSSQEIYLEPRQYEAAIRLGQEMDATVGNDYKNDPNGSFAVADRYILGMLGEFAFMQYLHNYGVKYDWNPQATGKSDDGDFTLYWEGKPVIFDVKTLRGHRQSLLVSKREYEKKHDWRYAVVRQGTNGGRYFQIMGICRREDLVFDTFPDGQEVWKLPVQNLKNPGTIVSFCDKA